MPRVAPVCGFDSIKDHLAARRLDSSSACASCKKKFKKKSSSRLCLIQLFSNLYYLHCPLIQRINCYLSVILGGKKYNVKLDPVNLKAAFLLDNKTGNLFHYVMPFRKFGHIIIIST